MASSCERFLSPCLTLAQPTPPVSPVSLCLRTAGTLWSCSLMGWWWQVCWGDTCMQASAAANCSWDLRHCKHLAIS